MASIGSGGGDQRWNCQRGGGQRQDGLTHGGNSFFHMLQFQRNKLAMGCVNLKQQTVQLDAAGTTLDEHFCYGDVPGLCAIFIR